MAANRFWGGIPAGGYSHRNLTFMATAEKNTYIDSVTLVESTAVVKATFSIMGTKKGGVGPQALMDPIIISNIGSLTVKLGVELEPGTLCYVLITGSDATSSGVFIISLITADKSGLNVAAFVKGNLEGGVMQVIASSETPGDTNQHVMETKVDAQEITVPALQSTPAVIDELEVLSDSASDTQDIIIDYWDDAGAEHSTAAITLTGTTPVVVGVETYDDIWVVKQVRVDDGEAAAVGNILLTDTST